jgi:hypothetical protein
VPFPNVTPINPQRIIRSCPPSETASCRIDLTPHRVSCRPVIQPQGQPTRAARQQHFFLCHSTVSAAECFSSPSPTAPSRDTRLVAVMFWNPHLLMMLCSPFPLGWVSMWTLRTCITHDLGTPTHLGLYAQQVVSHNRQSPSWPPSRSVHTQLDAVNFIRQNLPKCTTTHCLPPNGQVVAQVSSTLPGGLAPPNTTRGSAENSKTGHVLPGPGMAAAWTERPARFSLPTCPAGRCDRCPG